MSVSYMAKVETYEDVKKLINKITKKFHARHGGDFEELIAQANLIFLRAHQRYQPNKAAFTTWLWCKVWRGLQSDLRDRITQSQRFPAGRAEGGLNTIPDRGESRITKLLADLSEDAQLMVGLVLSPPLDVKLEAACKKGSKIDRMDRAVYRFLRDTGWSVTQILNTFREVREALSEW